MAAFYDCTQIQKKEEEEEERAETVVDISREATREERVWLQAFQMAPILSPLGLKPKPLHQRKTD